MSAGIVMIFLIVGAVTMVLVPLYWRARERRHALDIVKLAVERDGPVPLELMQSMQSAFRARADISPRHDLRRGFFLLALGAGMVAIGLVIYFSFRPAVPPHDMAEFLPFPIVVGSIGIVPSFVGVAYLLLGLTAKTPKA